MERMITFDGNSNSSIIVGKEVQVDVKLRIFTYCTHHLIPHENGELLNSRVRMRLAKNIRKQTICCFSPPVELG